MGLGYIAAAVALAPLAGGSFLRKADYLSRGLFGVGGYTPHSVNALGEEQGKIFGMNANYTNGRTFKILPSTDAKPLTDLAKKHGWISKEVGKSIGIMSPLAAGMNVLTMYQGYQEGGLGGARDALMLNIGVEASLNKWAYGVGNAINTKTGQFINAGTRVAGHGLNMSIGGGLVRGGGAYLGGSIGQSLGNATGIPFAGTAGAFLGSYIGGAPIRAMVNNPILMAGAAVAGVAGLGAGLTYGVYSFAREGQAYAQSRRGINTDGDMAAFMSQGAVTMRERSVQAIAKSHLNARSALGMEASFLHSPYKNYNSRYR
jgi:hypothetical protein